MLPKNLLIYFLQMFIQHRYSMLATKQFKCYIWNVSLMLYANIDLKRLVNIVNTLPIHSRSDVSRKHLNNDFSNCLKTLADNVTNQAVTKCYDRNTDKHWDKIFSKYVSTTFLYSFLLTLKNVHFCTTWNAT